MLHHDVVVQNGRIADTVLSLVAAAGDERAARAYFAVALSSLFPTALIWLSFLVPRSVRRDLPSFVLPLVAAASPLLLLALDRRLISQLALFGAASSGYCTGLFLVSVGLVPLLRTADGLATPPRVMVGSAVSLLVGVMFHEVLAALVLGALVSAALVAVRTPIRRRQLLTLLPPLLLAVALKASTPGLWSRTADTDQRQLADASLVARTDVALAFALVAFVPLLAYVATSIAVSLPSRGVATRRVVLLGGVGAVLVLVGAGYRALGGYPLGGVVTASTIVCLVAAIWLLRPARVTPAELVALGATALAFAVPVYGGLLPGRAWFFGEYLALLVALSWLARGAAGLGPGRVDLRAPRPASGARWLASALLGAGLVVGPTLAYEMLDKVNDNYAWRAYVDAQVLEQEDGVVDIPWTYPWNDMRPSFAIDGDHEEWEQLVRDYFEIPSDVRIEWNGSVDWMDG
ncbi:hypothetical protein EUA93_10060 [Nocardioides oleivorans]|uniref:Uncharacterized protein n=2 Tax=Nocardioides oleivorans TaxID=273676 RepID=A0A4Q2S2N9_9ACTN|nr:hypothetical protein EUA93_10060 [Nocardioides oleivorans]